MLLNAEKREVTGKKVKQLRNGGLVPASVYGPNRESTNVVLKPVQFKKLFEDVGYNKLFDLEIEGGSKSKALVKELQINPVTSKLLHVSLYEVDMKAELTAEIPVHIEGNAPAIKNNIGLLVTPVTHVKVTCLPENLPNEFSINVDGLGQIGDAISVGNLTLPAGVEFAFDMKPEMVLAVIAAPQKSIEEEAEEEAAAAAVAAEAVGETPAEGAESEKTEGKAKEGEAKKD